MQLIGEGFDIKPVDERDAGAILSVYRQCEDFLSLGPVPHASMLMVLADLQHSREEGGTFCGIYADGEMAGVVDYIPDRFEGKPGTAFLSLLMIGGKHRGRGLGRKVVAAVEAAILANRGITEIRSGVQVNNEKAIGFWRRMGYEIASGPETQPDTTVCYHLLKNINRLGQ